MLRRIRRQEDWTDERDASCERGGGSKLGEEVGGKGMMGYERNSQLSH